MKKLFLIIFIAVYGLVNISAQEIFKINLHSNDIYKKSDLNVVILKKYEIIKDYCVKNYFPMLKDEKILAGEDLNGFLDKDNACSGYDSQAAAFKKDDGTMCVAFNCNYCFDKKMTIDLMCHELAHISSGEYEHDTEKYQQEAERLKKYGIDIISTYTTSNVFDYYIGNFK